MTSPPSPAPEPSRAPPSPAAPPTRAPRSDPEPRPALEDDIPQDDQGTPG